MNILKLLVPAAAGVAVVVTIAMIALPMASRSGQVDNINLHDCLHSDNQTLVSKVVAARSGKRGGFRNFSEVQDAAQQARLIVETDSLYLSNDIWMVSFQQHTDAQGTLRGMALIDCRTGNVEFSGG